jgi:hypothetical protein
MWIMIDPWVLSGLLHGTNFFHLTQFYGDLAHYMTVGGHNTLIYLHIFSLLLFFNFLCMAAMEDLAH